MIYKKQSLNIKKQNNIVFFKDIVSNNFSFEDVLIDENGVVQNVKYGKTTIDHISMAEVISFSKD